jgi:hypothetical protein
VDPTTLFSYERHVDVRALRGTTLVVTLGAFADAGHAQALLDDHVLNSLSSRVIGRVDMDQVFDYTGRRPEITLDRDHFEDYERPEILLHEVTDPEGEPFFLLTGPEPSFQWERVARALQIVVEQLGVEHTLIAQTVPAPVAHTRALPVTRFAGRSEDIAHPQPLPAVFRIRSSFTSMLTMRLQESGHPTVGLVVHVPQYLHEIDYPDSAISLIHALRQEGGPEIPVGALEPAAQQVRESIDQQVAASEQLQQMVHSFEEHMDAHLITGGVSENDVPSADEIAAEVEDFLAGLGDTGGTDDADGSDGSDPSHGTDPSQGPQDGPTH